MFKEYHVNAKGNMEGPAREFALNGQVVREATYVDGNERGLVRVFYASGARRLVTFYGNAGRETASAEFTEVGQLSALRCADKPLLKPIFDDARACGFDGTPSRWKRGGERRHGSIHRKTAPPGRKAGRRSA